MQAGTSQVTLNRGLSTFSAALFGLAYICPTVVISTFGVLAEDTHGAVAAAWLILSLRRTALAVGLLWLGLGVVYWLVRTRGLSRPLAAKSST
jgi:hypothetical protein